MKIEILHLHEIKQIKTPLAACIGYFDGLHLGHQALIEKTKQLAKKYQCESALITFDPDPWVTIKKIQNVQHLTTMKRRYQLAETFGIQHVIVLDFCDEMAALSPCEFVEMLVQRCNLKALVCGFDYHYGKLGQGDKDTLLDQAHQRFEVAMVDSVNDQTGKISSTRICEALHKGEIHQANAMLGYAYQIDGTVIHGHHKGSQWGFPTANIDYPQEAILPQPGVYVGKAIVKNHIWEAMINLGHNPTCNHVERLSLEAHLLDCDEDLYNLPMQLTFCVKLRDEVKFSNLDELIDQLQHDKQQVKQYFMELQHE